MVNYWKSKVLPKIKKVFENPKKIAAADACKAFDESKEEYSKEFEDKKTELQPKVVELYEACPAEIKTLVKERKESSLKKHSPAVQKFLDELAKIEFPGSKAVCEVATKIGPGYLPGPVFFVLEKVATFIPEEEKKEEAAPPAEATPEKTEEEACAPAAAEDQVKEKEIVVEAAEKKEEAAAPAAETSCAAEPPKVEEAPAAAEPVPKAA